MKQARAATPTTFATLSLAVFAVVLMISAARHEPWQDETHTWRLAIDSANLRALYANARYEGTPLFFHVLLQSIGRVSRSWWAVVVLHSTLACGSAWIVLRHAPFPRLERLLIVGGYYLAFEYAVVVRSYALGVLLALLACAVWTSQVRRPAVVVLLLVLLANTSAMGGLLALAMAATFLYERQRLSADRVGGFAPRRLSAGTITLLALGTLCVVLVLRQLLPPSDALFRGTGMANERITLYRLAVAATPPLKAFVPFAITADRVPIWNTWALFPTSVRLIPVLGVSSIVLSAGALIAVSRRRVSMLLLGVSWTLYLLFFAFFLEWGSFRHHGHLVISWVVARWLAEAGEATRYSSPWSPTMQWLARRRSQLALALLAPSFVVGLQFIAADIRYPFSDVKRVAGVLRADSLARVPVIAVSFASSSVSGWMDRPFMTPAMRRLSTFSSPAQPTEAQVAGLIDSIAAPLLQRGCAMLFVTSPERHLSASLQARARLLTETPVGVLSGERLIVWMIPGAQSTACATGFTEGS